ncbi:MAG: bifunctional hydroxymethylpyrimidine kinase/phosphomethylpyrimidine kinase, partial [Longicatena sp.]
MRKVLTIAGTDPTGGAGAQADLKTFMAHKVYGMSIITALVAQNTLGVRDIMNVTPKFLEEQFDCVFEDIEPDAIKIGMVSEPELIHKIVEKLQQYNAQNIVVDPVMVSTSGSRLLADRALTALKEELLPLAVIITPNIPEAEVLSDLSIHSKDDMISAAKVIAT